MLRSLFIKNWCRAAAKTAVCAVTLSSAAVFSTPAMAEIVLDENTTKDNPCNLATLAADPTSGVTEVTDGYEINVGSNECAIWGNGAVPPDNVIDIGVDDSGKMKTLHVIGTGPVDYKEPGYVSSGGNSVAMDATTSGNGYGLEIKGNLDSTFNGGRIRTSQGIIVVNEQFTSSSPNYLTITGNVTTKVANMNITRTFFTTDSSSFGVGITDGSFTVGGDFDLTMTNISDWDSGYSKPQSKADLQGLLLGTGSFDTTGTATYTFEGNLVINQVQHVYNKDAVVTDAVNRYGELETGCMLSSGIHMDS